MKQIKQIYRYNHEGEYVHYTKTLFVLVDTHYSDYSKDYTMGGDPITKHPLLVSWEEEAVIGDKVYDPLTEVISSVEERDGKAMINIGGKLVNFKEVQDPLRMGQQRYRKIILHSDEFSNHLVETIMVDPEIVYGKEPLRLVCKETDEGYIIDDDLAVLILK